LMPSSGRAVFRFRPKVDEIAARFYKTPPLLSI